MDGLQEQWLLDDSVDVAAGLRALDTLLSPPHCEAGGSFTTLDLPA